MLETTDCGTGSIDDWPFAKYQLSDGSLLVSMVSIHHHHHHHFSSYLLILFKAVPIFNSAMLSIYTLIFTNPEITFSFSILVLAIKVYSFHKSDSTFNVLCFEKSHIVRIYVYPSGHIDYVIRILLFFVAISLFPSICLVSSLDRRPLTKM
jgi:hypothetical protein